ncbi:Fe(2+) transporter permease subunit FeoB [Martelella alba]|uniref:Ferrous iron transport protein B n=1 Tax=Martelella alba TaxID=2590451 RepID=A0ABY2SLF7_9HYPH|nr:Fe(2+) transporter permease subunit FeoB [Martelella alba]TKI06577.1 Fe(2+) transporter permease subunit FeoB [Martelella alba]
MPEKNIICVVGNPNCGKTTLFNALTGSKQTVGNWPGVTVEKKTGVYQYDGSTVTVVDLPGIYSLNPSSRSSEDERVARDYILSNDAQLVVNIVDAANLERNLYLTAQIIEMGVPMLVVVNMMDIAKAHQLEIDLDSLRQTLGCPVIGMVASRNKGVDELRRLCRESLRHPPRPTAIIPYAEDIGQAIEAIAERIPARSVGNPRWLAIQLLEGDSGVRALTPAPALAFADQTMTALVNSYEDDLDIFLADARYGFVADAARQAVIRHGEVSSTLTDRIDKVVLHRFLGIPIFFAVMYLMFMFTINVGSAFIDFFENLAGTLFVDGLGHLLLAFGAPEWLKAVLADGIGNGVKTVASFIPVIGCLYLFLSWLEDSGYMARAAFVMDRLMRALGLSGKAFVPLIVGFGCNVPAVMASRTIENPRDRIITVMMAPFMSCGARLPVYVLFATAFFPVGGQNLVFTLYVLGIVAAVATGYLLKHTALRGETSSFVMEMPPYHLPTVKGILLRTWERLKSFVLRAGKLIVLIVAVLSILNSLGTDGSFGNQDSDKSVLSAIGKTIVPVFAPMGMQRDNWPAAVGIFTGVFAKEAVVGTLNSLYSALGDGGVNPAGAEAARPFSLAAGISAAFATIPENVQKLGSAFTDPLGISVGNLSDRNAAAAQESVAVSSIDAITRLFDGRLGAFTYLMMILLYIPCCAAVSAIWREVGTRWTLFAAGWTTGLGYGSATVVYQLGTFGRHPLYSATAIAAVLAALLAAMAALRGVGRTTPSLAAKPQ